MEVEKFSVDKRYLSMVSLPSYLASGLYLVIFVPLSNVLLLVTCHLGIFPVMSTCRLGTFLVTATCGLGTFPVMVTGIFPGMLTCHLGFFLVTVVCGTSGEISGSLCEQTSFRTIHI